MDYELVIFDCDGVLIDSEIIACDVEAKAYTHIGYNISTSEMSTRFAGITGEDIDKILTAEIGHPLPLDFRSRIKDEIIRRYHCDLKAITSVKETINQLKIAKCIASSSAPAKLALGLVETELYEQFYPHIFSTALVNYPKPKPDIYLYAAKQMSVAVNKCIVFEDSVAGVSAATAAGMRCIGFTGGSHCDLGQEQTQKLIKAGADEVISDFREILNYCS
jgi:HAD superfamily hydrolase (TIGR01509 family)